MKPRSTDKISVARLFLIAALAVQTAYAGAETAIGMSSPIPQPETAPLQSAPAISDVELSIRFFDKRIYYPESEITLKVTITNKGKLTYRFKLADDRIFSLAFEARTPANRLLDPSDGYRLARGQSKPVLYRELALEPGEEYSFMERLERYARLEGPGSYTVRASFWPELAAGVNDGSIDSGMPIQSNTLILSVRPSPGLPPAVAMIEKESGEVLKALALPPDEVVRRTLVARQKGAWNEFFLYFDLEAFLSSDEDRRIVYNKETEDGRRRMVERYRLELQSGMAKADIVVLPFWFEILETNYGPVRGSVRVLEKFQERQLVLVKEYAYQLERRDDIWRIVGYAVFNKGTE